MVPTSTSNPKTLVSCFSRLIPARFFPVRRLDVVEFPDGLGGQRIFERTFAGPLHHQLREALQYLRNSIVAEQVIKYPDRAEADRFFNYPYDALEEALANAVYHKGYDVREPIEVRILPDRIEILSYPGADRSISIEGLRTFRAISRRYRTGGLAISSRSSTSPRGATRAWLRSCALCVRTDPPIPCSRPMPSGYTSS